jgi:transketolase
MIDVARLEAIPAAFGEALRELGARHERLVTVDADLSTSTMTAPFAGTFPERAHTLGLADQNIIGVGAGLARSGWIPFVCASASIVVERFETIRTSVASTNANVKVVGADGGSQMGLADIACLRTLPNLPIIQPADALETKQAVAYAVEHTGPLYLRLTRQSVEPVCPPDYQFRLSRWRPLRRGHDVAIVGSGGPLGNCLEAATLLAADGISAEVLNASTIKPLDEEALLAAAGRTGHVVTVEDHAVDGGLGGAVAELLGEVLPTPLKRVAVRGFGEADDPKSRYAQHGLHPAGIATAVRKFLNR